MSGSYGAGHPSGVYGYYRVKLSTQSSWTKVSNYTAHAITGLSPNTAYTVQCQLVDYYGQASATKTLAVTTNKPAAGDGATITTSVSVTTSTATINLSGGTAGAGGSRSYYRYYWNGA